MVTRSVGGQSDILPHPRAGAAASGHIDVVDDHVLLEIVLPCLLQRFAEVAQMAIRNRGNLLLTKRN